MTSKFSAARDWVFVMRDGLPLRITTCSEESSPGQRAHQALRGTALGCAFTTCAGTFTPLPRSRTPSVDGYADATFASMLDSAERSSLRRADPELAEHLAQVPFHRARTEEESLRNSRLNFTPDTLAGDVPRDATSVEALPGGKSS